jgi:hypothetical protein
MAARREMTSKPAESARFLGQVRDIIERLDSVVGEELAAAQRALWVLGLIVGVEAEAAEPRP